MKSDKIILDHGSGGKMSHRLISDLLVPCFENPMLSRLDDGAVFGVQGGRLAFSTDSYVVDPIFFPGGNIGDLAVNGTVNDIAMCGAIPHYLSVGLIIEEGFSINDLKRILSAMKEAAELAEVAVVTGDTKVVPKGAADRIFINTSGVGTLSDGIEISGNLAQPGDRVIVSGTIADHGTAILTQREGLTFQSQIRSDTAPLNHLVQSMLAKTKKIHVLRDPTRGGVATTLNEIAGSSKAGIRIFEDRLPIKAEVMGTCELLGIEPLYLANEGILLAFVPGDLAGDLLAVIRKETVGKNACIIGEVVSESPGQVFMETRIGGSRIVDMLSGNPLPRIC